uniref:F-box associated domain-containing protein n=1 Tax=Leersia perrieri TaxID=77586 RepID=A0A0D9VC10_9ORYZ
MQLLPLPACDRTEVPRPREQISAAAPALAHPIPNPIQIQPRRGHLHLHAMSFGRRFIYLVVDGGCNRRRASFAFHVHRINASRFFCPEQEADVTVRDLPRPSMKFHAPSPETDFTLLGGDMVLAADHKGRATIYDPVSNAVRAAPALAQPKSLPAVSVSVGHHTLYVLDPLRSHDRCFESLVYNKPRADHDWHWESLPPPPYKPTSHGFVRSYAVVGDAPAVAIIWVSTNDGATYSFDTARREWGKQGDWALPFRGLAQYVPDYNLWFALNDAGRLCAFDLAAATSSSSPRPRNVWPQEVKPPKGWRSLTSFLVYLGSGRFCVARFFWKEVEIPGGYDMEKETKTQAVFTGVEVQPFGKAGRGLRIVKHTSECYRLDDVLQQWVL